MKISNEPSFALTKLPKADEMEIIGLILVNPQIIYFTIKPTVFNA